MKAGVLFAPLDIRYTDYKDCFPNKGEIKIRMRACGICGSDVPRVLGNEARFYPIILGHEFCGDVVEVGEGTSFVPGDRVACAPLIPCMECLECQYGHYSLCKNYDFIGSRRQGAFAEYVVVPAANAVRLTDGVSYEAGALFEPATVALHGLFRGGFAGGGDTAILGAGNIGILAMQWAKLLGARKVAVFDISEERLELARTLGADETFIATEPHSAKYSYVFETAGQPDTIKLGFELVSSRGQFTCIGTPHSPITFDWKEWELLNRKEFRMTGSWMSYSVPFPGREWSLTAHFFGTGELKLSSSMIFESIPLCDIDKAFELFKVPGRVKGKVLIVN